MQIGLALPHYDFSFPDGAASSLARVADYARRAEDLGFDSVWVSDHLFLSLARYGGPDTRFGTPEALAMMGAVVDATERVRVGSLVLCAAFRNPAVLAQSVTSLQQASGGRIELGLGAGWYADEFAVAGIDFGTAGERITHLRSTLDALRTHLPDGPPLWVGSKGGPRMARIAAEAADGWNTVWQVTPEVYAERVRTLAAACEAARRPAETVRRSVGLYTLLGTDEDDLARRFEALRAWAPRGSAPASLDDWRGGLLVGTPKECAEIVARFEALGVSEMILAPAHLPFAVHDDAQLDLLASELLPLVR